MAKKKNATKRILYIASALFLLVIVVAIIARSTGIFGSSNEATEVELGDVQLRTVTQVVTASGKIQPEVQIKISPDVSGEIVTLTVAEGDKVKRGQLLARIKPDFYQAQVDQAEASVLQSKAAEAQRRADLLQAESDHKRQDALYKSGAISISAFETSENRFETAKASLESAQYNVQISQARLKESRENLSKTTIYAPIDGTISVLNVELGERVVGTSQMTGTEMMRVAKLDLMELEVDVNENDVVNVAVGDTASVEVYSYPNRLFKGLVTEIANSARVQGQGTQEQITNFLVKIRILDPHNVSFDKTGADDVFDNNELPVSSTAMPNFRPGMSGTVDIFSHTVTGATTVPIQAVVVRDFSKLKKEFGGTMVDSTTGGKQAEEDLRRVVFIDDNGKAKLVEVETGISDATHIVVLSGVSVGDKVVLGPYRVVSRTLEPNQSITPQKRPTTTIAEN
ncbi:MAG: efflux RND transporter periplasmic adaptor subunit [Bacteroidetes bacterium]|nr:efflux RND transporter periplasmic adaptor subunit [Bacteroidota bacterium]